MAQTDRLYKLKQWLDTGRCLSPEFLQRELEVSRSTVKRDIALVRDRLQAPLAWSAERGGWTLDRAQPSVGAQFELPGLWLSAEEIHALLTMQHLLAHLDAGGLVGPHIEPLMSRLGRILGSGAPPRAEVARHRLVIRYRGRSRDASSEREVSPQRLVHYRDNWYLDAWCHWRQALRSFSVDALEQVRVLDRACIDIADAELDEVLGAGYGIFAGREVRWAGLRFTPERSRWVAAETWHPRQRGRFDAEGRWLLDLPYADPRELVMDILRHVPEVEEVEVLWPEELAEEVREKLVDGLRRMEEPGPT